jgi:hypothetical protein
MCDELITRPEESLSSVLCLSVISRSLDNEEALVVEPLGGGINRSKWEHKLYRYDTLKFCFRLTKNRVSRSYKELPNRKVVQNI